MTTGEAPKTSFRADLLSVRTLLIFAAGFALALFLARTLPGASLFHPEARVYEKDVVITALNGTTAAELDGIGTSDGTSYAGGSEVWDGSLLNDALAEASARNVLSIQARIAYVVPRDGPVMLIRVEPRD